MAQKKSSFMKLREKIEKENPYIAAGYPVDPGKTKPSPPVGSSVCYPWLPGWLLFQTAAGWLAGWLAHPLTLTFVSKLSYSKITEIN